ncbi:cytokine receptor-like factor 3 [Harmonia axyridis]|uniref:cytokine receptor-like factor 3 n=1 Tax=Harmonia axyridis TaxID=115357 RepID=UPI001E2765B4|nr:cytokine receptor-like factor 3 [Harmonia axyridis]
MNKQKIKEICSVAENYLQQLKEMEDEISSGIKQINETADTAEGMLMRRFTTLQEHINNLLTQKKLTLLEKVLKTKEEASAPLQASLEGMREKIRGIEKFIQLGESIDEKCSLDNIMVVDEFIRQSEELEKFPSVSLVAKVPYITFEADDSCLSPLKDIISSYGDITTIGPVQICGLIEKPGAILVEWRMSEAEDQPVDVQEYCLQKAPGDCVSDITNFETCYVGEDTHFLSKDVLVGQYYSFRVGCKFEGSSSLSRWSIPMPFKTTIKSYNWKESGYYSMNDEFRIAKPLIDSPPILISEGRQYQVGYTIEFTILELDDNAAYIGLLKEDKKTLSKLEDPNGTFIIDSTGLIKVDGVTKSTFLPRFKKKCKICFSCECLKDERVVIHIDLDEKRVTYEWGVNKADLLYFAAELPTTKWKIMVE